MTFHLILFEFSLVKSIFPLEKTLTVLFGHVIIALEIISISVEHFSRALNVSLVPVCLNFSPVGKSYHAKTIFLTVNKITHIDYVFMVNILSLTVLLAPQPHTIIDISVWILHGTHAVLHIVSPFTLINISIGIVISTETLLAIFNHALEALSVLEEIGTATLD